MSTSEFPRVTIRPIDEYNQKLLKNVHPDNWINPQAADFYDLVVIGGGTAGLVVAAGAAGLDIGTSRYDDAKTDKIDNRILSCADLAASHNTVSVHDEVPGSNSWE